MKHYISLPSIWIRGVDIYVAVVYLYVYWVSRFRYYRSLKSQNMSYFIYCIAKLVSISLEHISGQKRDPFNEL